MPPVHRRHLNLYFLYHNKFALCGSVDINFKLVYFWNCYRNLVSIFGKCDKISKKKNKKMHSHNTKNLLNILVLLECKSKYLKNATAVNLKLTQTHFERNWKITVKQPKIYLNMCLIATITNSGSMRCLTHATRWRLRDWRYYYWFRVVVSYLYANKKL